VNVEYGVGAVSLQKDGLFWAIVTVLPAPTLAKKNFESKSFACFWARLFRVRSLRGEVIKSSGNDLTLLGLAEFQAMLSRKIPQSMLVQRIAEGLDARKT
jgi:hypothetical protein